MLLHMLAHTSFADTAILLPCREGRYNLDPDIRFFATPPHHGSLAQVLSQPVPLYVCFTLCNLYHASKLNSYEPMACKLTHCMHQL